MYVAYASLIINAIIGKQSLTRKSVSEVIAKVSHMHINICLRSRRILSFTLMQIFVLSALDLLFMLFSDVVQSIFFMNEFLAAFVAFYNWLVMDMPCMTN
jgi:hypothetical protein